MNKNIKIVICLIKGSKAILIFSYLAVVVAMSLKVGFLEPSIEIFILMSTLIFMVGIGLGMIFMYRRLVKIIGKKNMTTDEFLNQPPDVANSIVKDAWHGPV